VKTDSRFAVWLLADGNQNPSLISSFCHPPKTTKKNNNNNTTFLLTFLSSLRDYSFLKLRIKYCSVYLNVDSQVSAIGGADDPFLLNGNKQHVQHKSKKKNKDFSPVMMYTAHVYIYTRLRGKWKKKKV